MTIEDFYDEQYEDSNYFYTTVRGVSVVSPKKVQAAMTMWGVLEFGRGFNLGAKTEGKWRSVEKHPLAIFEEDGSWEATNDGMDEFIACVPYKDSTKPGEQYWIRHCVMEDGSGLHVMGDGIIGEPAGWSLEDITHWMPVPQPPKSGE